MSECFSDICISFKKVEKEMKPVSEILKKLRVKFLDQI